MKKIENTQCNKLKVVGATIGIMAVVGYFLAKEPAHKKTMAIAGAFMGLIISQGVLAMVVKEKPLTSKI